MTTFERDGLDAIGAYVDIASALEGMTIEPAWRAAVVANLATIMRAARLVEAFPLDETTEPGPLFTP